MQLKLGMNAAQLFAYRDFSGKSLQQITRELETMKMLERIDYADSLDDIKDILRRMINKAR